MFHVVGETHLQTEATLLKVNVTDDVAADVTDVRELLRATYYSVDRKQLKDMPLSCMERFLLKKVLKKVRDTDIETLLRESKLL